nr:hypothetical protein [Acidithiobacillus sp. S30A2]
MALGYELLQVVLAVSDRSADANEGDAAGKDAVFVEPRLGEPQVGCGIAGC